MNESWLLVCHHIFSFWALLHTDQHIFQIFITKRACILLTHRRHFWNSCCIWTIQKFGFIVIDILNFDNKLRFRFHRLVGESVQCLGSECIIGLLLPVQSLGGMNIPSVLINNENGTCPFTWQDVFDGTISFINIRVKLVKNSREMRLT